MSNLSDETQNTKPGRSVPVVAPEYAEIASLIPLHEDNNQFPVLARDVHAFLESGQQFGNWIQNRIDTYGFIEGEDFLINLLKSTGGRPTKEYHITLEMGKELCMIESNEKGKQARLYFIHVEKLLKQVVASIAPPSRKELALWVVELETTNERLMLANAEKDKQIMKMAPKAALMERVLDMDEKIDIGQTAKILKLPFGRNTLFKKLREKKILFKSKNEPKQDYIDRGYFELKEHIVPRENHPDILTLKILVTQKGLEFIAGLFDITPPTKKVANFK